MDQSLPPLLPIDNQPAPLFKNPLVIISLIIFILALVFAGLGWWLKTTNLASPAKQTLTETEKMDLLKSLQTQATSSLSQTEKVKLHEALPTPQEANDPKLSNEEKLQILKSLQQ